jgi:hypothetical protein
VDVHHEVELAHGSGFAASSPPPVVVLRLPDDMPLPVAVGEVIGIHGENASGDWNITMTDVQVRRLSSRRPHFSLFSTAGFTKALLDRARSEGVLLFEGADSRRS